MAVQGAITRTYGASDACITVTGNPSYEVKTVHYYILRVKRADDLYVLHKKPFIYSLCAQEIGAPVLRRSHRHPGGASCGIEDLYY